MILDNLIGDYYDFFVDGKIHVKKTYALVEIEPNKFKSFLSGICYEKDYRGNYQYFGQYGIVKDYPKMLKGKFNKNGSYKSKKIGIWYYYFNGILSRKVNNG